jgi:hypothetical protein
MSNFPTQPTRRYEVVKAADGWAVERGGKLLENFAAQETAIAHACRAAREDAERGWLGIVSAQTSPKEFHCYTPAEAARAAPRPYPRLVSNR